MNFAEYSSLVKRESGKKELTRQEADAILQSYIKQAPIEKAAEGLKWK